MVSPKPTKDSKPKAPKTQAYRIYFVIKNTIKPNSYLRSDAYRAMKEEEKWGPLDIADRCLTAETAMRYARRMVEGDNFVVVPAELWTARYDGAFCYLTPK